MLEFQILQQRVSDLIHLNFKSTPSSPSLAFVHLTCAYVDFISSISPREMVQISPSILQDLIFSCPVQSIAMPNPLERVSYQIFLNSKFALTSLALCLVLILITPWETFLFCAWEILSGASLEKLSNYWIWQQICRISSFQEEKTLWHYLRRHTVSTWRKLIVGVFACTEIAACMELAPPHSRIVNRESRQCYLSKLLFEKKILPLVQYGCRMFFALFPGFQGQWKRFTVNKRVGKHFSFQQQKRKRTF